MPGSPRSDADCNNYCSLRAKRTLRKRRRLLLFLTTTACSFHPPCASSFSVVNQRDQLLIHWKGEGIEGYSMQFRHVEFCGALAAVLEQPPPLLESLLDTQDDSVHFTNALHYSGATDMPPAKRERFNNAMQYVRAAANDNIIPKHAFCRAAERSALVHALYEVVARGTSCAELASLALAQGAFGDMVLPRPKGYEAATWCVRVRHYGADAKSEKRYGSRTRSLTLEKKALRELEPLLKTFSGAVNLRQPDCKIYVFDGIGEAGEMVLARRLVTGPQTSTIAPKTRICLTNTPLCPIAAFTLCNVAGVRRNSRILDPFAGSCAILLAAAMIDPSSQTVGIEIAHNGLVNRNHVREDFLLRNLTQPSALIHGDSSDDGVRAQARAAVGGAPFDLIITDPPYGIRESKLAVAPIEELFKSLSRDRASGTPLLRRGGKLVCFLPCEEDQDFDDVMPTEEQMNEAGLQCELVREQPLNDCLSRWLVSFVCTI